MHTCKIPLDVSVLDIIPHYFKNKGQNKVKIDKAHLTRQNK